MAVNRVEVNKKDYRPKHFQQYRAYAAGYVALQVSLMDSKSLPVGVLEYCCIHQQQMDELSWRQPTVYLWMQLGCIDEALVVMVLCTEKKMSLSQRCQRGKQVLNCVSALE